MLLACIVIMATIAIVNNTVAIHYSQNYIRKLCPPPFIILRGLLISPRYVLAIGEIQRLI